MDDLFEDWVKSSTAQSVQRYADRLIELGATWDTFSARSADDITKDLEKVGGIPYFAARDITQHAMRVAQQRQAPMAIFWDLENMPVPATSSGRDVSGRLKSILKPYGELVQFRGYASIGLNLIPEQKRSDLQLSGCLLVDCPHNGRKEVADKMIIVDAMNFCMLHPEGATLCFVTGDLDYAYLLAVIQRYKQYRTIVISRGTLQSMLDVNCDMKMRWETDILQLRSNKAWETTREDLHLSASGEEQSVFLQSGIDHSEKYEPLTKNEEWIDDLQFLRNLIRREATSTAGAVRKSLVANLLRQINPARFPNREAVKVFLSQATEKGLVRETGEGAFRVLSIPDDESTGMFPAIPLSDECPLSLENMPERALSAAPSRPYMILVKWKFCPEGTNLPSNVFVSTKAPWGVLMFSKLTDAQRTASEFPWLRNGILVDWRKASKVSMGLPSESAWGTTNKPSTSVLSNQKSDECSFCRAIRPDIVMERLANNEIACPECKQWHTSTSAVEKDAAAAKVVKYMEFLVTIDEVSITDALLRKVLLDNRNINCTSKKWAALWIDRAVAKGHLVRFKSGKNKTICLAALKREAEHSVAGLSAVNDTREFENAVLGLLWERKEGWMDRKELIQCIQEKFPEMVPKTRRDMFRNGVQNDRFVVVKGPYCHAVGLNLQSAQEGLQKLSSIISLDDEAGQSSEPTDNSLDVFESDGNQFLHEHGSDKNSVRTADRGSDNESEDDEFDLSRIVQPKHAN